MIATDTTEIHETSGELIERVLLLDAQAAERRRRIELNRDSDSKDAALARERYIDAARTLFEHRQTMSQPVATMRPTSRAYPRPDRSHRSGHAARSGSTRTRGSRRCTASAKGGGSSDPGGDPEPTRGGRRSAAVATCGLRRTVTSDRIGVRRG